MSLNRISALVAGTASTETAASTTTESVPGGSHAQAAGLPVEFPTLDGVVAVDARLWRGPTPNMLQYGELATAGVQLVIDMRSESDLEETARTVESFEMDLMALPTTLERSPQPAHVEQFARRHSEHRGVTYVHSDDTGRTSAIVGAHLVATGSNPRDVLADELATGSLSLAQMAYIASAGRRPLVVGLLDQVIDRPSRRLRKLRR